ncbi:hypothetical protein B0G93_10533 [Bacillus sp. V-88]|nr:hypothetical protein B0G93_10533 [Bacillus sp. V-88]SLK19793.1 hypothetical protein SAMN06295884_10533 [Bacillus sp. V-88]
MARNDCNQSYMPLPNNDHFEKNVVLPLDLIPSRVYYSECSKKTTSQQEVS